MAGKKSLVYSDGIFCPDMKMFVDKDCCLVLQNGFVYNGRIVRCYDNSIIICDAKFGDTKMLIDKIHILYEKVRLDNKHFQKKDAKKGEWVKGEWKTWKDKKQGGGNNA